MKRCRDNPWKGAILGMVGGVAGTLAMGLYWKAVKAARGEDSTEGVDRIVYDDLMGQAPTSPETKDLLSSLVHWSYGSVQGGAYGALRGRHDPPDLAGGAALGTALWAVSELGLPLLRPGKGKARVQPQKAISYESGSDPLGGFGQMTVRYYIYALLFVIFDVEAVFVFPWAIQAEALSWFGLIEIFVFIVVLLVGLAYLWRKGLLTWA